ncbi:MAG: hypothetical protein JNK54_08535 [Elusimicrobia bacterium]|jgi:hypothetical protein|nr:hypothetical protein [Elusimicrobiota bacterium]
MPISQPRRERVSVDVDPKEHRRIKVCAALHGMTIRKYVLESVRERLSRETEQKSVSSLSSFLSNDPVLKDLWDNDKDAAYDKMS